LSRQETLFRKFLRGLHKEELPQILMAFFIWIQGATSDLQCTVISGMQVTADESTAIHVKIPLPCNLYLAYYERGMNLCKFRVILVA
jgi:hypothetical protein